MRPSSMTLAIEAKLSSVRIRFGRVARDIGSALAHRDADMCRAQCRRVVDPVARDGDEMPRILQRVYDRRLLPRLDACVDRLPAGSARWLCRCPPSSTPGARFSPFAGDDIRPSISPQCWELAADGGVFGGARDWVSPVTMADHWTPASWQASTGSGTSSRTRIDKADEAQKLPVRGSGIRSSAFSACRFVPLRPIATGPGTRSSLHRPAPPLVSRTAIGIDVAHLGQCLRPAPF